MIGMRAGFPAARWSYDQVVEPFSQPNFQFRPNCCEVPLFAAHKVAQKCNKLAQIVAYTFEVGISNKHGVQAGGLNL